MKYVLGCDFGTSYFKAAVVDESGFAAGIGWAETPKIIDGSIVTITPDAFWATIRSCTEMALHEAGISSRDISGVSYGSQANTFLLLDEKREPLTDLIVWSSIYSEEIASQCISLWAHPDFLEKSGQGYTGPEFATAKLLWIKQHRPELWQRVRKFMTISDFFIFGLTGVEAADASTSSLLGCLDIRMNDWWEDGLAVLGLERSLFSPVLPMGEFCGNITGTLGEKAGLAGGTPLFAGGLDHVVAAIGAGLGSVADMSESTGTVLAALSVNSRYTPGEQLAIGSCIEPETYAHLSFYDPGAQIIEDYHDQYFPDISIDEMLSMVQKSTPGSSGLLYDDSQGDRDLSEQFVSLDKNVESRFHTKADEVRAVVENIAYRIWKLSHSVSGDNEIQRIVATGGANRSEDLLQVKADLFFAEVVSCKQTELGAFGAAILAAKGSNWFSSVREGQKSWVKITKRIQPDYQQHQKYREWIIKREKRCVL